MGCCGLSGKSDHPAELDPLSTSVSGCCGLYGKAVVTQLCWILSSSVCLGVLWAQWEGCDYTAVLDPLFISVSWGAVGSVGRLWLHSCAGSSLHQCVLGCCGLSGKAVITQLCWILSSSVCLGVLLRLLDQHHMCHTS